MIENSVIQSMLRRKSIRRYKPDMPCDQTVQTIVRAGQQAPFASQLCSVLLSRHQEKNKFRAPLLFTLCVDAHKWELIMAVRGWQMKGDDLLLLVLGMQDAALMAENMVIAAESLGLASCFLGDAPFRSSEIIQTYRLPQRVFPLVQLAMGYPAEDPPPRPRYPIEFTLFEDHYPEFNEEEIHNAMQQMDQGYLEQDYYRRYKAKIRLLPEREETYSYEDYSWTEHISRKWGQRLFPDTILLEFERCGFSICPNRQPDSQNN